MITEPMRQSEIYLFCDESELQAWLGAFVEDFVGTVAHFPLWKPAREISPKNSFAKFRELDGAVVFYFGELEIFGSDSEFSVAGGENSQLERLSISRQFNRRNIMPYWICGYMMAGSDARRRISGLLRRIKKYTKTGLRLVEGSQSFPYKIGRYSDGAVALQQAGTKFVWSEGSSYTIIFKLE